MKKKSSSKTDSSNLDLLPLEEYGAELEEQKRKTEAEKAKNEHAKQKILEKTAKMTTEMVKFVEGNPRAEKDAKRAAREAAHAMERTVKADATKRAVRKHRKELKEQKDAYETMLAKHYASERKKEENEIREALERSTKVFDVVRERLEETDSDEAKKKSLAHREICKCAKMLVKKIEPHNKAHIFLFQSTRNGWWKMGGNSLAIYKMMIGGCVGRVVRTLPDSDNFSVFADGVICMRSTANLERDIELTNAHIKLDRSIDFGIFNDYIRAYKLDTPLQEFEVRRFRRLETAARETISNTIFATAPEVEINKLIVQILRESFQITKMMDSLTRSFFDNRLMAGAMDLMRIYYDVANNSKMSIERRNAFEEMDFKLGDVMTQVAIYSELGAIDHARLHSLSLVMSSLRDEVRKKIKRFSKSKDIQERMQKNAEERQRLFDEIEDDLEDSEEELDE